MKAETSIPRTAQTTEIIQRNTNTWLKENNIKKNAQSVEVFDTADFFFDFVCPISFLSRLATLKLYQLIESSVLNNNSSKKKEDRGMSKKTSNLSDLPHFLMTLFFQLFKLFCVFGFTIIFARQNGMNFLDDEWSVFKYSTVEARQSFLQLKNATNLNFISLSFCWYQTHIFRPEPMYPIFGTSATDDEITSIVQIAHENDVKVMLEKWLFCADWTISSGHA